MAMLIVALCVPMAAQNAAAGETQLSLPAILGKLSQAQAENHERIRAYIVTREYKLFNGDSNKADSQVMADVSFVPPSTKDFEITKSTGSGQGEKVVRKVLAHEQQMSGSWQQTALSADNYDFELLGTEVNDGRRCYVLNMKPKRDSKELIRGRAWVDSESFNVRKIEGELAKTPSWWVKRVQLSLQFDDVQGMWMQTSATASADVRMMGKKVLTARDVNYKTGAEIAAKHPAKKTSVNAARLGAIAIVR